MVAQIYGKTNIGDEDNPSYRSYKLTRKQYYHEGGINKANRKSKIWTSDLKQELERLSRYSPKTASGERFDIFIQQYKGVYKFLWKCMTQKKWGRQRFDLYIKKRKCLDSFFQSMHKKGEQKPVIAYGNSSFSSGGKREVNVPVKYVREKCELYYETVYIDEYNTSKICPCCDNILSVPVLKKVTEETVVKGNVTTNNTPCIKRYACSMFLC